MTSPELLATPLHPHATPVCELIQPVRRDSRLANALGVGLHTVDSGPRIDRGYLCVCRDLLHLDTK